jgi:hypothetical protein
LTPYPPASLVGLGSGLLIGAIVSYAMTYVGDHPMVTKGLADKRAWKHPPRTSFTELDRITVRDIGTMVSVELDQDTHDFSHLLGKKIVINGRMEYCHSVERLAHGAPWKRGERIHLLIRKAKGKRMNHAGSIGPDGKLSTPWSDNESGLSNPSILPVPRWRAPKT